MEDYEAANTLTPNNASGSITMEASDNGIYWAQVSNIPAKNMDKTFYVSGVYTSGGNTYCTGVVAYSLSKYCMNNATSGDMQDLAKATAVYGYYAQTYFANL
jgi:hypothetical protein